MQSLRPRIKVIEAIWTPGSSSAAMTADTNFRALDERPGGRYAYAKGIRCQAVCTVAETKAGAGVSFPAAKQWQMLRAYTLGHGGHKRTSLLSFLDHVRLQQQAQEIYGPDLVADKMPIAAIATGAGTTSITLDFVIPLAPGMYKRGGSRASRFTGLVSFAELKKDGVLEVLGTSAANMTGAGVDYWSCTSIAFKAWLECVYLDYPVEPVQVRESIAESSVATILADWDGERRLLSALVTDDADASMTVNDNDGVETVDGKVTQTGADATQMIAEANENRLDGINDWAPAVIPLVVLTDRDLEDCPIVQNSYKLQSFNSKHAGNYRLLTRQSRRWDLNTALQILRLQCVPQSAIDAYRARIEARSVTDALEQVGLAVHVLQSEDARGVQRYA